MGCDVCGKDLVATLLRLHLETYDEIYQLSVPNQDLIIADYPLVTYLSILSMATAKLACPVPGRSGTCRDGVHKVWPPAALPLYVSAGSK